VKHTMMVEIEVEVEFTVDGEDRPARISGRPENCSPAEHMEVEIEKVSVVRAARERSPKLQIDILPALSQDAEEAITDEVYVAASEKLASDRADAMEREADFRSDR